MKILICLDNSSFAEKLLAAVKTFTDSFTSAAISVVHIVDEQLFYPTTGYEVQLTETLQSESKKLKELCIQYLGPDVNFVEEFGIPRLKIDEVLNEMDYDLLIAGSHSSHGLGERLMGSFAEHLLRISKKPVLIIP